MSQEGRMLQATTNAVLALYGYPEPRLDATIEQITVLLNALATEKRLEEGW